MRGNLSYRVGEAYAQGDAAPRGLTIDAHVPLDGTPLSIGPMPFRARGISLINQTAEALTVTDDRGVTYFAEAFTSATYPASDSLRFTALLAAPVSSGKCTVVVADMPQPLNTSQLASLAPSTGGAVTGRVSAAGAVVQGTGFTVTKGAAGIYTINFTTAFVASPLFLAMLFTPGGAGMVIFVTAISNVAAAVTIRTPGAALSDQEFMFHAVEMV